jgi:hypothetical protein
METQKGLFSQAVSEALAKKPRLLSKKEWHRGISAGANLSLLSGKSELFTEFRRNSTMVPASADMVNGVS